VGWIQPTASMGGTSVDLRLNLALVDPSGENEDCLAFLRRVPEINQWDANFMSVAALPYKSFGG
jgi:hypothetical protein